VQDADAAKPDLERLVRAWCTMREADVPKAKSAAAAAAKAKKAPVKKASKAKKKAAKPRK